MTDQQEHETLAAALLAFQGDMPEIVKDQTANVPTKTGGSYRYSYADLSSITKIALPVLQQHGLVFTSGPDVIDGNFVLRWSLIHVHSAEQRDGAYPLPPPGQRTAQEVGGAITYGRRYAFCAVLGITPTDDDDDARTMTQAQQAAQQRRAEQPTGNGRARGGSGLRGRATQQRPISDAQITALHTAFAEVALTEREDKLHYAVGVIKREITSSTELTMSEASRVIDCLKADAAGEPWPDVEGEQQQ